MQPKGTVKIDCIYSKYLDPILFLQFEQAIYYMLMCLTLQAPITTAADNIFF